MKNKPKKVLSYLLIFTWCVAIGLPESQAAWSFVHKALKGHVACSCCRDNNCCNTSDETRDDACTCSVHLSFSSVGIISYFSFANSLCLFGQIIPSSLIPLQAPSFSIDHPPTLAA
jgi:hypothetical protein